MIAPSSILAAIGFVLVVTRSSIVEKVVKSRLPVPVRGFLSCPMCFGFWVGVFLGPINILDSIARGFTVSLLSYTIVSITDALQSYMDHNERIAAQWDVAAVVEEDKETPQG